MARSPEALLLDQEADAAPVSRGFTVALSNFEGPFDLLLSLIAKQQVDITEHSICQPGRPLPQGEFQPGSSGEESFHRTKSPGLLLCASTATRAPACCSSRLRFDNWP